MISKKKEKELRMKVQKKKEIVFKKKKSFALSQYYY